jgi:hypothetical protein
LILAKTGSAARVCPPTNNLDSSVGLQARYAFEQGLKRRSALHGLAVILLGVLALFAFVVFVVFVVFVFVFVVFVTGARCCPSRAVGLSLCCNLWYPPCTAILLIVCLFGF